MVQTQTQFEVEVATPFIVIVAPKPSYKSDAIPWDYVAEARRKGKAKMDKTNAAQGMTRTGRVYTLENVGGTSKEAAPKPPVVEADAHKNALMKVLSEAYVPAGITSGELANMVGQVLESHKITLHEDELPLEWLSHNRVLHITMQFEDKFIARVLIDGVLDISATYNLLLGRPWIHAVRAVDSNLHQAVKFEWNHEEVIIHGDRSSPIYPNQTVPVIENRRKLGGETYHRIERVNAIEKDQWWSKKIESILLWIGYEPDKGLGKKLQGITKPVQPHIIITYPDEPTNVTCNDTTQHKDSDSEDDVIPKEIIKEVENFENKPKSNLEETGAINLGDSETFKETRISIHLSPSEKDEYIMFLKEYEDIFAWSYDDMAGLSTSIVAHKLPTNPTCPQVKQKLRKFKPDMSFKIKEEVTKQIKAKVLRVVKYPTWLTNIVPVPKNDGKVRVCVDYRDLKRASPNDNLPLPSIHILNDNCAKHELQSFVDCFARYHQIWMDEEDAKKTAFITPLGVYCYKMMSFGLKNVGATYMRAMTTIFHDMIHKEIEVYMDDVIIKSRRN
ncbi:uncharacterized protein [Nicotiana tomentosiformis]|uniref:uncharacterized protein n=1 Tax=Nicotiana tomentosiformis TaxID=4098 RepID=UPI00388C3AEB